MFLPDSLKKKAPVLGVVLLYLVIDLVLTCQEIYYLNVLPVVVLLVYLAFSRIDVVYFIIVGCTPLSIPLIEFFRSSPIDFYIPTEPMLFGVLVLMIYRGLKQGSLDRKVLNHPVTYAILINVSWILVSAITSSMPLVSFKYLLARIWFLATFYFLAIQVFRKVANIRTFIWCYSLPLMLVVGFAIYKHLGYGLYDKQAAHVVMNPFFRDHTSYGAILAMVFFALGSIVYRNASNLLVRFFYWLGFGFISLGLLLSYTRAAWLSVFLAFGVLLVTRLGIKFKYLALAGLVVLAIFFSQRLEIQHRLESNRQDSSADLTEHVKSMSNVTTDDSNLERLNRWTAALRMFHERPVVGWGPGTYMFQYAPFQLSSRKTLISTDFGDLGNAHSEYIGPLCESGVPGLLTFLFVIIMALVTGFRVYHRLNDTRIRQIVLGCILAFITYLIHGFLNNFLDTDKASALFWGFIAIFVSLEVYYLPEQAIASPKVE